LSDYVTLRLANARRLAMERYHQVWGWFFHNKSV
jgi:hypothetical protein